MTPHEERGLDRQLAELPAIAPDAERAARVRARARAALSRDHTGLAARILKWIAAASIVPDRRESG
jgi:hypothetical protein